MHKEINQLPEEQVAMLNSPLGLKNLFAYPNIKLDWALNRCKYDDDLQQAQVELIKLQEWVIRENKKVIILFEGRDAAGKGGAIRRITAHINPRFYKIVALPKPTEEEQGQWYFQRYVNQLPQNGEIVFFDRSWYNRAAVEPVNAFCTADQYETFMGQVNEFERMLTESGTYLLKLYFSISKDEQAKRFEIIKKEPLKKWKMSPVDESAQMLWDEYTKYKDRMFIETNTDLAPWQIIRANKKTKARLEAMRYILDTLPYK